MTIGKPGIAPCGHVGEHLTANYVRCPQCDRAGTGSTSDGVPEAVPADDTDEIPVGGTQPLCRLCASDNITVYPGMWATGKNLYHCNDCGANS